jgi:aminoglycoside 6'-N-acetyltransferase I
MAVQFRMLGPSEAAVLERVAPDVFDEAVDPVLTREFLTDPRHHLAVALDEGVVVGMTSAVHYVHPDKRSQLFINEVGVAPTHHRQGIGRRLIALILERGRELGCTEAWVGTELGNTAARGLYASTGGVEDAEPFALYVYPLGGGSSPRARV